MVKISVSVLNKSDYETIIKLDKTDADYFHIDVMDGKFVDETNFGISEINTFQKIINKKMDIHLMVFNPSAYIEALSLSNIAYITVHYETLNGDNSVLEKIKNKGIKCGISVKPNTDIRDIFYLLDEIDLILVMSVEPGYGGQEFLASSLDKIKLLKEEVKNRNSKPIIAVDGGVNNQNAKLCINAGCDMLVAGSYIISSDDYQVAINTLKS